MARPKKHRELDLNNDADYAEHIRRLNQVTAKERPYSARQGGHKTPTARDIHGEWGFKRNGGE